MSYDDKTLTKNDLFFAIVPAIARGIRVVARRSNKLPFVLCSGVSDLRALFFARVCQICGRCSLLGCVRFAGASFLAFQFVSSSRCCSAVRLVVCSW